MGSSSLLGEVARILRMYITPAPNRRKYTTMNAKRDPATAGASIGEAD
jgi:hypothetical protein